MHVATTAVNPVVRRRLTLRVNLRMNKPATLPEPQVTVDPKLETRRHKRRTEQDKRRIIAEADACTERGELSALCRRENIRSGQISTWRQRL